MNIERKNTLFVISLVLVVQLGVALAGFLLVRDHVAAGIEVDLERARNVFIEAQKNRFDNLLTVARSVRDEPSLIAAVLTGDIGTVRGMLDTLYPRPGADFMAVFLDTGPGGVAGAGSKPHYTSPQVLSSPALVGLVRNLAQGHSVAVGNALLYDSWLQLVAIAIENPLGGRIGALVVGNSFRQADLHRLRQLVYADMAVFSGNVVLASSIDKLQSRLQLLNGFVASARVQQLDVGTERYSVRILPVLRQAHTTERVANVLLAARHSSYWKPYRVLGVNALYLSLIILLVAAIFGVSISRRSLTRPIQLLARATHAIEQGDLSQRVALNRKDELGQLTSSFNAMLTALNSSQNELRHSQERFRDFASSSSDWFWETGPDARFTFVSASVSDTLGMSADSWLGRSPAQVFPGSGLGELMTLLRSPHERPEGFKDVEIWVRTRNEDEHCLRLNGVPLLSGKRFCGFRGTARDITKLKQDEKRMVVLANQDHLTGLFNRRRFIQDLHHEIRRIERHRQLGVLLLIDIDHLKLINDTAGHSAGDQIIVQVAGLLKRASREQDLLARISGDEFAVAYSVMTEAQGMERAQTLLERINGLKPRYGGRTLNISASIGLVSFPAKGKVPVELLAKADAAMSAAKSSGRNRIHLYDETDMMRERMDNQLVWKDRLLEALENDTLQLMFQPIVSVPAGTVSHYEVLVRMREKDGTLITPGKFIPAAEQFGLIQRLDQLIVSKAIRCLADLPHQGKPLGLSINLSGLSVGSHEMYRRIESEVREASIDPARITFEITETAACEQLDSAAEFIQKIRQLGCNISLDDFGVGFSSFSYLKHLRADTLKIDGSFIRDIHNSNADQLFVKALVDVARGMGMSTIAEFVENEQVLERVRALGVDYVQGYHVGKPQARMAQIAMKPGQAESASVA
ncbi:MAG: EAL domain-containing protein [Gammaproteobacteria bacterium]